jgi:hypothetical protein
MLIRKLFTKPLKRLAEPDDDEGHSLNPAIDSTEPSVVGICQSLQLSTFTLILKFKINEQGV